MTSFSYPNSVETALQKAEEIVIVAPQKAIKGRWLGSILDADLAATVRRLAKDRDPGHLGWAGSTLGEGNVDRIGLALLPDGGSRHNSPTRMESIFMQVKALGLRRARRAVIAFVEDATCVSGVLAGVWRAFPEYSRKGTKEEKSKTAFVACDRSGSVVKPDKAAKARETAGRWAARLVDMPCEELDTAKFVREARKLLSGMDGVKTSVIDTAALVKNKLMGIHSVGRAAKVGPRMLVLEYKPKNPGRKVGLVGKGVVYDTGGLSLKGSTFMRTMKGDMGGAAAVVGAFYVLAKSGCPDTVIALAPLAENAIGPGSYRPDDIVKMHSGRTVEIDNTDAEGRLLLGDGVSWAARKLKVDVVIDAATLTGAQPLSTGQVHAAVVSNREGLERRAVKSGRESGDLTHPLPWVPELHQAEFKSTVADLTNSVANRKNAQSSCAAWFVYRHIDDLDVPWLHIDLAGPAHRNNRGTGYGVGLISNVVMNLSASDLNS